MSEIPATLDYDAFGRIYEYFLGEFARTEGQKGGEFYTPSSIVRLLVEVIDDRSMAASWTRLVVRAACSSRAHGSSPNAR